MNITVQAPQPGICVGRLTSGDLADAVALARAHGWTCTPPPDDAPLPDIVPGVMWQSLDPDGEHWFPYQVDHRYDDLTPFHERHMVTYRTMDHGWATDGHTVPISVFQAWARRTGARPMMP